MLSPRQRLHPAIVVLGLVIFAVCILGVVLFARRHSPAEQIPMAAPKTGHPLAKH